MKRLILFLIFFVLTSFLFATGWQTNNTGYGISFKSVQCADIDNIWLAGENGIVLKSSVGGNIWETQNSGISATLHEISFADDTNGTAVGDWGAIIHTSNGGTSWNVIQDGWMISYYAVKMVNQDVSLAAGQNTIFAPLITYTFNGWQSMNSVSYYLEQTPGSFHEGRATDIDYIDSNTWFTANTSWLGEGAIVRTTNAGNSWETVFWSNNALSAIHIPTPDHGYAVGNNGAFVFSVDGGNTWNETFVPAAGMLKSVYFTNSSEGWVVGNNGYIAHTDDGGLSWQTQDSSAYGNLNSIDFCDNINGWIAGDNGIVLFTDCGGMDTGILEGTVTLDAGNGIIEEVQLTINNSTYYPDDNGFFHIELTPGTYDLSAELAPYDPLEILDIIIQSSQITIIDITLYYNVCSPPENPILNEDIWQLSWQTPDTSLQVLHYNCYLDGNVFSTEELFWDLPIENLINGQQYTVGVSAEYAEGESELITLDFVYTGVSVWEDEIENHSNPIAEITAFPNPFSSSVIGSSAITFTIQNWNHDGASLEIFNLKGQKVRSIPMISINLNNNFIIWNGRDDNDIAVCSGVYFARLRSAGSDLLCKVLILK